MRGFPIKYKPFRRGSLSKILTVALLFSSGAYADEATLNQVVHDAQNLDQSIQLAITKSPACFTDTNKRHGRQGLQSIELEFLVGEGVQLEEEQLGQVIEAIQSCWSNAFASAGFPELRLGIRVAYATSIENESNLPAHFMAPALDSIGTPLPGVRLGHKTHRYRIFLSKLITRSHVKPVWRSSIPKNIRLLALRVGEARTECDRFYAEELDPFQSRDQSAFSAEEKNRFAQLLSEYHGICDRAHSLESSLEDLLARTGTPSLPSGSDLYISAADLDIHSTGVDDLARTITHELGHAWGGLADRYGGSPESRERHATNLMGRDVPCSLTRSQVESILRFRRSGKEERFE